MKKLIAPIAVVLLLAGCAGTAATVAPAETPGSSFVPVTTPTEAAPSQATLEQPTPEPADTPAPGDPTTFQPGDPVTVTQGGDDWAVITVSQVSQHKSYGSGYLKDTPDKGNIYIQALVTYKALQDGVDYNEYDWQVFVDGNAVDNSAFVSEGPKPELNSGTLPKGRTAKGWLVYEVPVKGRVLMSYGNTFSNDAPVFEVVIRTK